jgi:hypothetical protein
MSECGYAVMPKSEMRKYFCENGEDPVKQAAMFRDNFLGLPRYLVGVARMKFRRIDGKEDIEKLLVSNERDLVNASKVVINSFHPEIPGNSPTGFLRLIEGKRIELKNGVSYEINMSNAGYRMDVYHSNCNDG